MFLDFFQGMVYSELDRKVKHMTLGDIIKDYRKSHHISQDVIAKRANVSKAYISILERNINPKTGQAPIPSLKTINAIAKATGKDFDLLFTLLDDNIKTAVKAQLPSSSRSGLRIIDKIRSYTPDYTVQLKDISIDSETYRLLTIFAKENYRTLQEEIEHRLHWSLENEISSDQATIEQTKREEQPAFQYAAARGGGLIKIPKLPDDVVLPENDTIDDDL